MATISLSKDAPTDTAVSFSFGNAESFSLEGSESHTTDDVAVIADASAHPWLEVSNESEAESENVASASTVAGTQDVEPSAFDVEVAHTSESEVHE